MRVEDIYKSTNAEIKCRGDLSLEVKGCYVSDLLSDVLANSSAQNIWITHHTHPNIVAVAAVKELSGIIIVGVRDVEPETLKKADAEKINISVSPLSAYEAAGVIYNLFNPKAKQ